MARHALVDLAQIFHLAPATTAPDRLPDEAYSRLYEILCQAGVNVCRDDRSITRLREMRALYEGYAQALSEYLGMPLPPWMVDHPRKDNWLAVAKVRERAEAANPATGAGVSPGEAARRAAAIIDTHHDF
jgi:hypothetical protein